MLAEPRCPRECPARSFYPLLTGGHYEPREYVFGARLHHGNAPIRAGNQGHRLSTCRAAVRSNRYKLIYNLTPQMEYWPVDSGGDPGWQAILAAHKAGTLKPEHERTYFQRPRPVLELYDLEADPGELNNLAGKAGSTGTLSKP